MTELTELSRFYGTESLKHMLWRRPNSQLPTFTLPTSYSFLPCNRTLSCRSLFKKVLCILYLTMIFVQNSNLLSFGTWRCKLSNIHIEVDEYSYDCIMVVLYTLFLPIISSCYLLMCLLSIDFLTAHMPLYKVQYRKGESITLWIPQCLVCYFQVDSWWRFLYHCSYCLCLCDDSQSPSTDRYFSLTPVLSDTQRNMVRKSWAFTFYIFFRIDFPNGRFHTICVFSCKVRIRGLIPFFLYFLIVHSYICQVKYHHPWVTTIAYDKFGSLLSLTVYV